MIAHALRVLFMHTAYNFQESRHNEKDTGDMAADAPTIPSKRRRQRAVAVMPTSRNLLLLSALILALAKYLPSIAAEECGNCFGAGEPGQCCNTCDEIIQAYKKKKWGYKESDFGPCRDRDAKFAKEHDKLERKKNNNNNNNNNSNQKKTAQNASAAQKKREEEIAAKLQREVDAKKKREKEAEALQRKKKADAEAEAARQREIAERVKKGAEQAAAAKKKREEEERAAKKKKDEEAEQKRQREEELKRQREQKDAAAKAAAERRAQQQERQHQQANERMAKKSKSKGNDDKSEANRDGEKPEESSAGDDTMVNRVKSKIHNKIQDVRDHHPLVDKTASVLVQTAHVIDEVAHKALESETGQATLHRAKDAYAKASEGAGSVAHKLADKVAPSTSARYVSESHHSVIGGFIVIVLGSIAALSAYSCYLKQSKKRRMYPGIRKEKADLDYEGGDIEGGAVFRDSGDKQQPFQLYHEFEYKMRRRYQGSSYSYASADSPPQPVRTPPQSMQQSNTYTYRQHSVGKNGEPVTVTYSEEYKDKPITRKHKNGAGYTSRRRLLTTVLGVAAIGYVGMAYVMPADMTFGDLWLLTAEFVDAKLGHHGLVL